MVIGAKGKERLRPRHQTSERAMSFPQKEQRLHQQPNPNYDRRLINSPVVLG